ncbi:MAG: hypothetical protein ACR2QW_06085 [bacterium]
MSTTAHRRSQWWLAVSMLILMLSVLAARHQQDNKFALVSYAAMALVALLSIRKIGIRETYLLIISGVLAVAVYFQHFDPISTYQNALNQAAFMMAFILLLGLLYEAAVNSPAITECGRYITGQLPGRRYAALHLGTGLMSVLFNLGVISLLTPLIQGGVRTANPGDPLNPIRERRQLVAVQRGFAWGIIWSPTALAPLTILDLVPGIDRPRWIMVGFIIASIAMLIGWLEDYLRFRYISRARQTPRPPPPALPRSALLRFTAAFFWLLSLTLWFSNLSNDTVVFGLMLACPPMMIGWVLAQQGFNAGAFSRTQIHMRSIIFSKLPHTAPVAITLACSGFIGRAAAALVPADQLIAAVGIGVLPDYVFLSLLPLAITLLSFLALSPIVTSVFLGSVLGTLEVLPIDATLLAISISCGWALAMTISPFVTLVLVMVRASGHSGTTLSLRWNLSFALVSAAMLVPVFWILTSGS